MDHVYDIHARVIVDDTAAKTPEDAVDAQYLQMGLEDLLAQGEYGLSLPLCTITKIAVLHGGESERERLAARLETLAQQWTVPAPPAYVRPDYSNLKIIPPQAAEVIASTLRSLAAEFRVLPQKELNDEPG